MYCKQKSWWLPQRVKHWGQQDKRSEQDSFKNAMNWTCCCVASPGAFFATRLLTINYFVVAWLLQVHFLPLVCWRLIILLLPQSISGHFGKFVDCPQPNPHRSLCEPRSMPTDFYIPGKLFIGVLWVSWLVQRYANQNFSAGKAVGFSAQFWLPAWISRRAAARGNSQSRESGLISWIAPASTRDSRSLLFQNRIPCPHWKEWILSPIFQKKWSGKSNSSSRREKGVIMSEFLSRANPNSVIWRCSWWVCRLCACSSDMGAVLPRLWGFEVQRLFIKGHNEPTYWPCHGFGCNISPSLCWWNIREIFMSWHFAQAARKLWWEEFCLCSQEEGFKNICASQIQAITHSIRSVSWGHLRRMKDSRGADKSKKEQVADQTRNGLEWAPTADTPSFASECCQKNCISCRLLYQQANIIVVLSKTATFCWLENTTSSHISNLTNVRWKVWRR